MNLSAGIIGSRKSFCDECKFLASVEIQEHRTMNSPIKLCTLHLRELIAKLVKCEEEITHG